LPQNAVWVWSDGSAEAGVTSGGGGATVCLPSGEVQDVCVPAGAHCSSTRAELVALRAALEMVTELLPLVEPDGGEREPVVICSDSMAALTMLSGGAAAQRSLLGIQIWTLLLELADRRRPVHLQWVPAHCGLPGNERADELAQEASALPQLDTPVDVRTITKAVARAVRTSRQRAWPLDDWYRAIWRDRVPGPIRGDNRVIAVTVHQLRVGQWSGSEQYLHKIGRRPAPSCQQCRVRACPAAACLVCGDAADTPEHVLMKCWCLGGVRLIHVGNVHGDPRILQRDDVAASLVAGYLAHKSPLATPGLRPGRRE
jgi:ribonuclease HI